MDEIRVLVADAQLLVADALSVALSRCIELDVLDDHPQSAVDALKAVMTDRPDVALLDFWLYGMEAPALTREILARFPDTKVLNLSWFHGRGQIDAALAAGAVGFLPKSLTVDQVDDAIHRAHAGEAPVFAAELSLLVDQIDDRADISSVVADRVATLTRRELEILRMIAEGVSVKQISVALGIKTATTRTHVREILHKMGAQSQIEAIVLARDQGLVAKG